MKTITYLILLFAMPFNLFSQKLERDISNINTIEIKNLYGDLKIIGNNSDKIKIERTGFKVKPEALKIKPASNYKIDNTQLGLNFEFYNNTLIVYPANKESEFGIYEISIPKDLILKIDNNFLSSTSNYNSTDKIKLEEAMSEIIIKNIKNEINLSFFIADLKVANINGPIVLSGFDGSYDIDFARFSQNNPSMLNVKNGEIKVHIPFDSKLNIQLNTESGKIISDHIIKNATVKTDNSVEQIRSLTNRKIKKGNYTSIEGEINKGGTNFSISTSKADIRLFASQYPVIVPVIVN